MTELTSAIYSVVDAEVDRLLEDNDAGWDGSGYDEEGLRRDCYFDGKVWHDDIISIREDARDNIAYELRRPSEFGDPITRIIEEIDDDSVVESLDSKGSDTAFRKRLADIIERLG